MLFPKKVKHRKHQRGGLGKGISSRGTEINFGEFAIRTTDAGMLNSREIEAARRAMTRYVQRGGRIWIRVFPDHPLTRKGTEVPMGKGKGAPEFFVAKVRPGRIIFEMGGVEKDIARRAMRLAADKLSVKTKFIEK